MNNVKECFFIFGYCFSMVAGIIMFIHGVFHIGFAFGGLLLMASGGLWLCILDRHWTELSKGIEK